MSLLLIDLKNTHKAARCVFLDFLSDSCVALTSEAWCRESLCWGAACHWGRRCIHISETTARLPSAPPPTDRHPTSWIDQSWGTASSPSSSCPSPLPSSQLLVPSFQAFSLNWLQTEMTTWCLHCPSNLFFVCENQVSNSQVRAVWYFLAMSTWKAKISE